MWDPVLNLHQYLPLRAKTAIADASLMAKITIQVKAMVGKRALNLADKLEPGG